MSVPEAVNTRTRGEGLGVIEYDEPHTAGRDRRGVLISSLSFTPFISWSQLNLPFRSIFTTINPNVVRFRMPSHIKHHQFPRVQSQLSSAFLDSFPNASPANIRVFETSSGFRNVDIETPYNNVTADEIVAAAKEERWKAGGVPLGEPQLVGFRTSRLVFPVKFDNIPYDLIEDFVGFLPDLFRHVSQNSTEIRYPDREPIEVLVVDVWRIDSKVMLKPVGSTEKVTSWVYANTLLVLIEFITPLPGKGRIYEIVHDWPGWVLWKRLKNDVLVHLSFPGKFDYCQFCKYHAQEVEGEGEGQRHMLRECQKVECNRCGGEGSFRFAL